MAISVIARLTLLETIRRRLILAVFLLTGACIFFTGWGLSRLEAPAPHGGAALVTGNGIPTLIILLAYMFSVILAAGSAFLAAPAIGGDADSGLLFAILPRPIRRSELLLGKWLGFAALVSIYALAAGGLEFGVVRVMAGYVPPHPLTALAYIVAESLVVLTLALFAGTRLAPMTGSILVIALFGIAWIAGIAATAGAVAHVPAVTTAGNTMTMLLPTDGLWRGAVYNLESPSLMLLSRAIGTANPFLVPSPPALPYIFWAAGWVAAILSLAAYSFSHRDL